MAGNAKIAPGNVGLKRAYLPASADDGKRVLVDRLWPRGVRKADAAIDLWLKDIAPSAKLRQWFGHDPARWPEFKRRYFQELDRHPEALMPLVEKSRTGTVTLVFAAKDAEHNNAVALKEYLERRTPRAKPQARPS